MMIELMMHIHVCAAYSPPAVMIPGNRLRTLLHQALELQVQRCVYHNAALPVDGISFFSDHSCYMYALLCSRPAGPLIRWTYTPSLVY